MSTRSAVLLACLYNFYRLPGFNSVAISPTSLLFISNMKECITKAFSCISWITCGLKSSIEDGPPSMRFQVVPPPRCYH